MQHGIAEQIIEAMNGLDQAFGRLNETIWRVEDEEERRRMLRVLAGLIADSYFHITVPIVNKFPDLHPDPDPPLRLPDNFEPGLPVRRMSPGPRLSEATIHDDRMYLSGVVPKDTSQDITGQTSQVLAEIKALLEKGGSGRTRIVSALIFLADMNEYAAMNAIWGEWIVAEAAPARTTVQAKLRDPKVKIEIMAVAAL